MSTARFCMFCMLLYYSNKRDMGAIGGEGRRADRAIEDKGAKDEGAKDEGAGRRTRFRKGGQFHNCPPKSKKKT